MAHVRVGEQAADGWQIGTEGMQTERVGNVNLLVRAVVGNAPWYGWLDIEREVRVQAYKVPDGKRLVHITASDFETFMRWSQAAPDAKAEAIPPDAPWIMGTDGRMYPAIGFDCIMQGSRSLRYTPDLLIGDATEIPRAAVNGKFECTLIFAVPVETTIAAFGHGRAVAADFVDGVNVK